MDECVAAGRDADANFQQEVGLCSACSGFLLLRAASSNI